MKPRWPRDTPLDEDSGEWLDPGHSADISNPALDALMGALATPVVRTMPRVGERLGPDGRYLLMERLGRGGQGAVYRAQDVALDFPVALKIVLPDPEDSPATWADRCRRFEDEIALLSRLEHETIVSIKDQGMWEDTPFLVMELLRGETLRELLARQGCLEPARAVALATALALGLEQAHARGIVHRDLKPDNIFVQDDDRVKILDFGLAHLLKRPDQTLDDYASIQAGTAHYMAPEQWLGQPQDPRTDIWALGVVLFEMLTGTHPFTESDQSLTERVLNEPPRALKDVGYSGEAMAALQEVLSGALQRTPLRRYKSMALMAQALERASLFLQPIGPQAPAPAPLPSTAMPGFTPPPLPTASTPDITPPPSPRPPARRAVWRRVALVALVAALVGLGAVASVAQRYRQRIHYINQVEIHTKRMGLDDWRRCTPTLAGRQACLFYRDGQDDPFVVLLYMP